MTHIPATGEPTTKPTYLGEKTHTLLKHIVQLILPAFASLYFGLAVIWGLPAAQEVVGTVALIATFLGVVLGISTKNYKESGDYLDGEMIVTEDPTGRMLYSLELNKGAELLSAKDIVIFGVVREAEAVPE